MKMKFYAVVLLLAILNTGCGSEENYPNIPSDTTNASSGEKVDVEKHPLVQAHDLQDTTQTVEEEQEPVQEEDVSLQSDNQSPAPETVATDVTKPENEKNNETTTSSTQLEVMNLQGVTGKIVNITNGHGDNIVIFADKMYLYSLSENKVKSSASYTEYMDGEIILTNDGYAFVCDNRGSDSSSGNSGAMMGITTQETGYTCTFYDTNLTFKNTISVTDMASCEYITVSYNGKKIAYAELFEKIVYIIDVATGEKSKVSSGDIFIDFLSFAGDSNTLGFKGGVIDLNYGVNSITAYGSMNIDGSDLKYYISEDYPVSDGSVMAGNTLLLSEDARMLTGRMKLYNTSTDKTTMINLNSTKETDGKLFISGDGNYFATGELKNYNSLVVRLYSKDGLLLNTVTVDNVGKEYFYRGSAIAICEETRTAVISLGNWNLDAGVDTIMYSFGF